MQLFDSRILKTSIFDIFQVRQGQWLAIATQFLDTIWYLLHFLVEVIKISQVSIKFVKICWFQQLMEPLFYSKRLENLNFWHDSGQALRMTGNSNPISWHSWIYVTYSGRGDQIAHTCVEIDEISRLD